MLRKIYDKTLELSCWSVGWIPTQLRKIYNKTLELSAHPRAPLWLMLVAFCESIFFPIPQDVMLLPMMLANRKKAFYYATMCLIASVGGGVVGYYIGLYLFTAIAEPILAFYGYLEKMAEVQALYDQYGSWFVILGGLSPVPYKVVTISSGAFAYPLGGFIIASVFSRGVRFYILAVLTYILGDAILKFVDRYFAWLSTLFFVLLVLGFIGIKAFI